VLSSRCAATSRAQVLAIERDRAREPVPAVPHAAAGLARWIDALAAAPPGRFSYPVPAIDGDGLDRITIVAELA